MAMASDDTLSMGQARERYFAANGFDGSYGERWVTLKAGPFTIAFPNAAGRVRAVKLHDLHHVVTGYATTWTGEAEIGAWELASGCAGFLWAWYLNLSALAVGLAIAPREVFRAFVRGRHTDNLYWADGELRQTTLQRSVGEVRRALRLDGSIPAAGVRDMAVFAAFAAVSAAMLVAPLLAAAWAVMRWM
jgi:hypothetical protein